MSEQLLQQILDEIQNVKTEQKITNERLSQIENKSDAIMEQVAKNAENITDLKENQQTIGNVINQIATIQQRQEETINLLARRSIDQEAVLKRIQ